MEDEYERGNKVNGIVMMKYDDKEKDVEKRLRKGVWLMKIERVRRVKGTWCLFKDKGVKIP